MDADTEDQFPQIAVTPSAGHPSGPLVMLDQHVRSLVLKVDRLQQSMKLLRWIAVTSTAFGLGSIITIASSMLGWARDDESARAEVRQLRQMTVELKGDVRELTRHVYSQRFGVPSPTPNP